MTEWLVDSRQEFACAVAGRNLYPVQVKHLCSLPVSGGNSEASVTLIFLQTAPIFTVRSCSIAPKPSTALVQVVMEEKKSLSYLYAKRMPEVNATVR